MDTTLNRSDRMLVAGHTGLAGSAIWQKFSSSGFSNLIGCASDDVDLLKREDVFRFFSRVRPKNVVLAAARVGGIGANQSSPHSFISDNLQIQVNVMDAALANGVERLLFLGSSCAYPRTTRQPIREDMLLAGPLEQTNDAYAIAKIAGILQVQAVRRQYGLPWICAMPTNLYGPGDNFASETSHVLPALIKRYVDAHESGNPTVVNWGTGTPRREFLHVSDLADACLHLIDCYDSSEPVNVGTGRDATISEVASLVADIVGYRGITSWDITKPDGTSQKLLDVSKLAALGWTHRIGLREGLARTISWYRAQ